MVGQRAKLEPGESPTYSQSRKAQAPHFFHRTMDAKGHQSSPVSQQVSGLHKGLYVSVTLSWRREKMPFIEDDLIMCLFI